MSRNMVKIVGCIFVCALFIVTAFSSAANVENIRSSPSKNSIEDNICPDPPKIEDPASGKSGDGSITLDPAEPGKFGWYNTPVVVTFHAEDDIRLGWVYYKVTTEGMEEPEWTMVYLMDEWVSRYDLSIIIDWDGKHTANFYAEDHVHNIGPVHSSDRIQIDMTSPEITLKKEKVGLGLIEINFTATVSDATSGVYVTKFYIDNSLVPVFERVELTTVEFIWSKLDHGGESVKATVEDWAGNTASSSASTQCSQDSSDSQDSDSQQPDNSPSLFTQLLQNIFGRSTVPDAQTPTSTPLFSFLRNLILGAR